MSLQQQCDVLAFWLRCRGKDITGERIYKASPSGEVMHILELWFSMQQDAEWLEAYPCFDERVDVLPDTAYVGDLFTLKNGEIRCWDGSRWLRWA